MTISYSIDRASTSTADVAVPQLNQGSFSLESTDVDAAKGVAEARFTIPTGDPVYKTSVVANLSWDPRNPQGNRRALIAINTWSRESDSVLGTEKVQPFTAQMTLNWRGRVEEADLAAIVGNLYGLSFNTLTSKIPDTAVLTKLLFGIPDLW